MSQPPHQLQVDPRYQPIFRELGLDAETVFSHDRIRVWRSLDDRENCTLDARLHDGSSIRWHIKRYAACTRSITPADAEVRGRQLLVERNIPTVDLVAWGRRADGRSFVVLDDLRDFGPADKLIAGGLPFATLLEPTARLTAQLHAAGLHHRDLYLCHFFARRTNHAVDLRLIDTARVRPLPRLLWRRWVVKDLAQFWYSTTSLPVTNEQRHQWLECYARARRLNVARLRRAIRLKVRWIAFHDRRLARQQPLRNRPIPDETCAVKE